MTLGFFYILTAPYVAGLGMLGGLSIGGFRYTGWLWVAVLVAGPLICLLQRSRPRFPVALWGGWFGFVLLSLAWVGEHTQYNIQDALQIVTPFVVGIVASAVVRNERQLRMLRRGFTHALLIIVIAYFTARMVAPAIILPRVMALTTVLLGGVFVASFRRSPVASLLGWSVCLGLCVISGGRMATLALLLLWIANPAYRRRRTPVIALAAAAFMALSILALPEFRGRFFLSGQGSVDQILQGHVWSSGRFEAWPLILERAREHFVIGAGVGETNKFVPLVWEDINKPHNDYLRIIFEQGVVGLALFLTAAVGQLVLLRRMIRRSSGEQRRAFIAAYLGLVTLLVVSYTDNTIVYGIWYMHPLFAILGAAYGLRGPGREAPRPVRHRRRRPALAAVRSAAPA